MSAIEPTPYPAINELLGALLDGARSILGQHFVAMYLEGSLVSADFDQDSDVDFIVVLQEDVTAAQFAALQQLHDRIATQRSWYADQLEGFYVSRAAMRRYDPAHALNANIERGPGERLKLEQLGTWWRIHLAITRERGITLAGPEPRDVIDPVTPEQLRQTMATSAQEWAVPKLKHPEQLRSRGGQAYVVLTLCRMLYTIATGGVVTKRAAAEWALRALDSRWHPLVARAWAGRHNPAAEGTAHGAWRPLDEHMPAVSHTSAVPDDEIAETLELIRYTIARSAAGGSAGPPSSHSAS